MEQRSLKGMKKKNTAVIKNEETTYQNLWDAPKTVFLIH